jgi:hypothetical protein
MYTNKMYDQEMKNANQSNADEMPEPDSTD